MSKRKNMNARGHTNRAMNDSTYTLRRRVLGHVYEAKKLTGGKMPRVDIRITDCTRERVLGQARMGDCVVWIPASSVGRADLRHIVFHELLHAVYGLGHCEGCPLMASVIRETTREQQDERFRFWVDVIAKL